MNMSVPFKWEAVSSFKGLRDYNDVFNSDFYDKNSMTCSSTYFDPAAETDFLARNLQHTIKFRRLSKRRRIVRITSGLYQFSLTFSNILICLGNYAACGFEMLLKRKHEPLMYQVGLSSSLFYFIIFFI